MCNFASMDSKPTIHPNVIEHHAKIKAWNEYVIEYSGLIVQKRNEAGYRSISVRQGSFGLYHDFVINIHKTTNAEMHKRLHQFLERYINHLLSLEDISLNVGFKPPPLE